ncbi:hypothetical protein EDD17DRAFT_107041 [Pisolithus thermaeus]|nr:hypothetical protein EV401DRAFT_1904932 [Pisolithus croceorrhizus]KAI6165887.1 hypothetical protein EDD17DRAFT_107041 [Pisolithus thermaeus]
MFGFSDPVRFSPLTIRWVIVTVGLRGRGPVAILPTRFTPYGVVLASISVPLQNSLSVQPDRSMVHCSSICIRKRRSCIGPTALPLTFSSHTTHDILASQLCLSNVRSISLSFIRPPPYRGYTDHDQKMTKFVVIRFLSHFRMRIASLYGRAGASHCTLHLPPCVHALFISLALCREQASCQIPAHNSVPPHGVLPRARSSQPASYSSLPSALGTAFPELLKRVVLDF